MLLQTGAATRIIAMVIMAAMHEMHEGAGEQYEIGEGQQNVAGMRPQEPTTKCGQEEAHDQSCR